MREGHTVLPGVAACALRVGLFAVIAVLGQVGSAAAACAGSGTSCLTAHDGSAIGGRVPLILIHGWNRDSVPAPPLTHTWDNLLAYFATTTLPASYKPYLFTYYSNSVPVPALGRALRDALDASAVDEPALASKPLVLVAHSLGGLVARTFLRVPQLQGGWAGQSSAARVLALVTLGTPHHGSPFANGPALFDRVEGLGYETALRAYYSWYLHKGSPDWNDFNRTDLWWDNYDDLLDYTRYPSERNVFLTAINSDYTNDAKIIAYAGSIAPSPGCYLGYCAGATILGGLLGQASDGVVPVSSALLYGSDGQPRVRFRYMSDHDHGEIAAGDGTGALFGRLRGDLDQIGAAYFRDVQPPALTVTVPAASLHITEAAPVRVAGTVTDNAAIAQVRWSNETTGQSGIASGTSTWSFYAPLAVGENRLSIAARDSAGNESARSIVIRFQPAPVCADGTSELMSLAGAPPAHPAGSLIRTRSTSTVYLVRGSDAHRPGLHRDGIPSVAMLQQLYLNGGFEFRHVIWVSDVEMATYPVGGIVDGPLQANGRPRPDGTLIKGSGAEISIVTDTGNRRAFPSLDVFARLGYLTCNVVTVPDTEYFSYPFDTQPVDGTPRSDVVRPAVTITTPTAAASYETAASLMVLSGTASDNVAIAEVTWSSSRGLSGIAAGAAAWSTGAISLFEGANTLTVRARDAAGNTGEALLSVTRTSTAPLDTTPPAIAITSPSSGSIMRTATAVIEGNASDATGLLEVRWRAPAGAGLAQGTGTWTAAVPLVSGVNHVVLTAVDLAGNARNANIDLVYSPLGVGDATQPSVAILSPTTGASYFSTLPTITLSGSAYDDVAVDEVTWTNSRGGGGTATGTLSWIISGIILRSGVNIIRVTVRDKGGNLNAANLTVTYLESGACAEDRILDGLADVVQPTWVTAAGDLLLVSTPRGVLQVINVRTLARATIRFDPYPHAWAGHVAVNGSLAYVPLSNLGSNAAIAVVDLSSLSVLRYLPTTANPETARVVNGRLYVAHAIWWSDGSPAELDVFDLHTEQRVATLFANLLTTDLAVVGSVQKAYAANRMSADVTVFDVGQLRRIGSIKLPIEPMAVAAADDRVYVAGAVTGTQNGEVIIIDPATDSIVGRIEVGRDPVALVLRGTDLLVVSQSDRDVEILDRATNRIVRRIVVGVNPTGVDVSPASGNVYVANQSDDSIAVLCTPSRDVSEPLVAISAPVAGGATYRTSSRTAVVSGTASDERGLSALTWTDSAGRSGAIAVANTWQTDPIELTPGSNLIRVTARDTAGNSSTDSIIIDHQPALTLTLRIAGPGAVMVTGLGRRCAESTCSFEIDGESRLLPLPDAGAAFGGWSGDADCIDGGVSMLMPTTCAATFVIVDPPRRRRTVHLTGSARSDVLLYNSTSGVARLEFNNPTGGYHSAAMHLSPDWSIVAGDYNGDGLSDFLYYNPSTGRAFKGLNSRSGQFGYAAFAWSPGWSLTAADFDGDGSDDVFAYNPGTGRWVRCISRPDGTFAYTLAGVWSPSWTIYAGDFNADGRADLFLYNQTSDANRGRWLRVLSNADETISVLEGEMRWRNDWQVHPGDYDGDGATDLFLYRSTGEWYRVFFSPSGTRYETGLWSAGWDIYVGTFNDDGRDDLFVYNPVLGRWFVVLSEHDGWTAHGGSLWSAAWGVWLTDTNGDGITDLLLYNSQTGRWCQAVTSGAGMFTFHFGAWEAGWKLITRSGENLR